MSFSYRTVSLSPRLASNSRPFQFLSPLSPSTRVVLPSVMVHLSYLASEETLYSKDRWVSSVKVRVRVLEE